MLVVDTSAAPNTIYSKHPILSTNLQLFAKSVEVLAQTAARQRDTASLLASIYGCARSEYPTSNRTESILARALLLFRVTALKSHIFTFLNRGAVRKNPRLIYITNKHKITRIWRVWEGGVLYCES